MADAHRRAVSRGWLLIGILLALAGLPMTSLAQTEAAPGIPDAYQQVASNAHFQLYLDPTTLAFKLLDARSGYVWHSGIDQIQEGDRLNRSWQAFARSGLSITYLDRRGVDNRASIANSAHTLEVTPIERGAAAQVTFEEYGISIGVRIQLDEDGVRVAVPFDTIQEQNPDFRLGRVFLHPFLGATRGGAVPGYMVLPDGVGSIIRFADSTRATNIFIARCYGADLGMYGAQPNNPRLNAPLPIALPIYGIVHGEGEHALLAIADEGAGYSELRAHPAGIITNFNFVHNAFIYNESYFQATNRSGAGVTTIQAQPNRFDIVMRYRFLTGAEAGYVGIGRSYQRYLVERGALRPIDAPANEIGARLEFLGGDKEPVLLWSRFIPMTTLEQMRAILMELGISKSEVIYYGWQPFGASSMPPTALTIEPALGDLDALRTLAAALARRGGRLSLYLDPQAALLNEPGYSPFDDLAIAITNAALQGYNRSSSHFFTFAALQRRFRALSEDVLTRAPDVGLSLDGIGWMLYTDYRDRSQPFNREQAIRAYQDMLAQQPLPLGLYRPNAYLFGAASAYYDMPTDHNGYIYMTEAVPLLPIILSGHIPYYGTPLNFSADRQTDLLRHAEYGIYPSFFLTHEPTAAMLNTPSVWIYTSAYAQWGAQVRAAWEWLNALLAPTAGQPIVAHQRLADGVYATGYANGRWVIVNYSRAPFTRGEIAVDAQDAVLVRKLP